MSSSLISLAMLKVNIDSANRDYLDYLTPFVAHIIITETPDPITDSETAASVERTFGLCLPRRAVQLVLRRLARNGYLKREDKVFRPTAKLPPSDFEDRRAEAQDRINQVIEALVAYSAAQLEYTLTTESAETALTQFLSRFSVDCLSAYVRGTALPEPTETNDKDFYVVARFVAHAHKHDPKLFASLIVVVKGQMLANALICPDLEATAKKFNHVTFYFDTPLVVQLLGLEGDHARESVQELTSLVRSLQGTTAVFEHTVQEVHTVLGGASYWINKPGGTGRIVLEMRKAGRTKSDLLLVQGRLREQLIELRLTRRRTPKYTRALQIDEAALQVALEDDVGYRNPKALEYDVNSIRSIYALRDGKAPVRLENATAVMVTSNSALAQLAYEFGRDFQETAEVSSVITDFSLANVAWLKAPLGAPNLPERELIAMCYAALEPHASLWGKYLDEIERLEASGTITPQDHELLRFSPRAGQELMNLTLGSEEDLAERTVPEILRELKADLTREKDEELASQRESHLRIATALEEKQQKIHDIRSQLYWSSERFAKVVSRTLMALAFVVLALAAYLPLLITNPYIAGSRLFTGAVNILIIAGLTWGLLSGVFGLSVRTVVRKLEGVLLRWQFSARCQRLGLGESDDDAMA